MQLKSSIPIGANVEICPKGFTLGVKAETQKNIFNLPQVTSKCWTLWPCIDPKGETISQFPYLKMMSRGALKIQIAFWGLRPTSTNDTGVFAGVGVEMF